MAKHVNLLLRTALLLGELGAASAEPERCVAAAEGRWNCGQNVTEADAAPLPEPQSRNLPPVMLIDPARFGEADAQIDAVPAMTQAPELQTPEAAQISANDAETEATAMPMAADAPTATDTSTESPVVADSTGNMDYAEAEQSMGSKFVVQLAVASNPRGFDALLAKLGAAARNSQRRQLANGSWVLLIGNYNSIAEARIGIPSSVPGAFARDISTLNFR